MNTSTYYDLKLYEGSDIVNPLVVDVPNYEAIDEIMHDNAVESVGLATELLNGTVHAITRDNPDAAVFRFVATANWTAGDTMTVDGIQVTALLPSGEALGSGSYVINSNVIGIITGTLVTLLVTGGTATLAQNSEKLGGELPAYYATATAVQNAQETANAAGLLANAANTAIENIKSYSANERVVGTWTDGSPVYEITVSRPLAHVIADVNFNIYRATLVTGIRDIVSISGQIEYDGTKALIPFTSIARNNIVDVDTYFNIDGSDQLLATTFFRVAVTSSAKIDATIRYIKN